MNVYVLVDSHTLHPVVLKATPNSLFSYQEVPYHCFTKEEARKLVLLRPNRLSRCFTIVGCNLKGRLQGVPGKCELNDIITTHCFL